jgi:mono/diheme cytochrome c family protein
VSCVLLVAPCAARELAAQRPAATVTVDMALVERGRKLFSEKQCNTCHTIGRGKAAGPDLKNVTSRRSLDWIRRMIRTPEVMLLEDSVAQALRGQHNGIPMPNMEVGAEEVEALIHFIASKSDR